MEEHARNEEAMATNSDDDGVQRMEEDAKGISKNKDQILETLDLGRSRCKAGRGKTPDQSPAAGKREAQPRRRRRRERTMKSSQDQ